jgi:hypothetical protein
VHYSYLHSILYYIVFSVTNSNCRGLDLIVNPDVLSSTLQCQPHIICRSLQCPSLTTQFLIRISIIHDNIHNIYCHMQIILNFFFLFVNFFIKSVTEKGNEMTY